ncbi:MAG: phosphate ABC transporter substrate-binding/OmpA family protein [Pseudomonadota bacterium]
MSEFCRKFRSVGLIAGLCVGAISPSLTDAGEVRLTSADGTLRLKGDLIDFVDDSYIIQTAIGEMRVAANWVRCEGIDCPQFTTVSADVKIAGSDMIGLGLMPLLMSGYANALQAEVTVNNTQTSGEFLANFIAEDGFGDELGSILVTSSASEDPFDSLLDGSAEIVMASRRIAPSKAQELSNAGLGNMTSPQQEHVVAVDSLVVIVNPSNPLGSASIEDLQRIYSGQVTNWSELGGADLPIMVVEHPNTSDIFDVFKSRIFSGSEPFIIPSAVVVADHNAVAAVVNENPGAIGYVGYAFQRRAKALNFINECGVETAPDAFSVKTEEYDLQQRLYLYNASSLNEKSSDFLAFTQSEDSDQVVAKAGFVDLGIKVLAQGKESPRAKALVRQSGDAVETLVARAMLAEMEEYDRLSTTFRFRTGSTSLDERGLLDMQRLTRFLETKAEGTRVNVVGFTDDVGSFDSNLALSMGRADQALRELQSYAGDRLNHIEISTSGFGELSPAACNTADSGRAINRRVEVWIEKASG